MDVKSDYDTVNIVIMLVSLFFGILFPVIIVYKIGHSDLINKDVKSDYGHLYEHLKTKGNSKFYMCYLYVRKFFFGVIVEFLHDTTYS